MPVFKNFPHIWPYWINTEIKNLFFLHWQMVHFAGLFAGCFFYYLGSQLIDKTLCNCWKHALLMYTLFSRDSLTAIKLTTSALFSLRASAHPMYLQSSVWGGYCTVTDAIKLFVLEILNAIKNAKKYIFQLLGAFLLFFFSRFSTVGFIFNGFFPFLFFLTHVSSFFNPGFHSLCQVAQTLAVMR